jgi:3-methylfumaryl-CoA hydratase
MAGGDRFDAWVGRQRVARDTLGLERARKLAATLDQDPAGLRAGAPLPLGWHWIFFHEAVPRSALAEDGHERRGDFLPPVPLPRRMWAGGRLDARRPLAIGADVERVSTIRSVELKEGRSGSLAFVTVEHRLSDGDGLALIEEQDIVYVEATPRAEAEPSSPTLSGRAARGNRPAAPGDRSAAPLEPSALRERFTADEVTLFRFSALTFNGHRIHYDRRFATEVEGYPGLVVHGPLLALLLTAAGERWLGAVDRPAAPDERLRFEYRALRPLFCGEPVEVFGRAIAASNGSHGVELEARHVSRGITTRGTLRAG